MLTGPVLNVYIPVQGGGKGRTHIDTYALPKSLGSLLSLSSDCERTSMCELNLQKHSMRQTNGNNTGKTECLTSHGKPLHKPSCAQSQTSLPLYLYEWGRGERQGIKPKHMGLIGTVTPQMITKTSYIWLLKCRIHSEINKAKRMRKAKYSETYGHGSMC